MQASDNAIRLIQEFEGYRSHAYSDPASKDGKPYTIGYGHTDGVYRGQQTSRDEALDWLHEDAQKAAQCVNTYVTRPVRQQEFDALVSFVFNLGCTALRHSTLLKLLNQGEKKKAAEEFEKWVYANGHKIDGLEKRRRREKHVFVSGYI